MKNFLVLIIALITLAVAAVVGLTKYLLVSEPLQKADAIIAISGGDTLGRTRHAVKLYNEGWAPKLILSGAARDPESPSNAFVMEREALKLGVPQEAIIIDEVSRDTKENAVLTSEVVKNYQKIILVTSHYHQRRAAKAFRLVLGPEIRVINSSAEDKNWHPKTWWLTPFGWWVTISEVIKNLR